MRRINREPLTRGKRDEVNDSREIREHLGETQAETEDLQTRLEAAEAEIVRLSIGAYGMLSVKGGTAEQDVETTYVKLTGFNSAPVSKNLTADFGNDRFIVPEGTYSTVFQSSFSGTVSTEFEFVLFRNDVEQPIGCHRTLGTGGDVGSCSFVGLIKCDEDTELDVRVKANGLLKAVTPVDMQFTIVRIGDLV